MVALGAVLALSITGITKADPASATTMTPHYVSDINIGTYHVRMSAFLEFTGKSSFRLSMVSLCDLRADGRAAYFRPLDQEGNYGAEKNGNGAGTCKKWDRIDYGSYTTIDWVQLDVWACSHTRCIPGNRSVIHYNPYA